MTITAVVQTLTGTLLVSREGRPDAIEPMSEEIAAWRREGNVIGNQVPTLDDRRARRFLRRDAFAKALAGAGVITWAEAASWAAGVSLPTLAQGVIAAMPAEAQGPATFTLLTSPNVARVSEWIGPLATAAGLSDDQVDGLFGIDP